MCHVGGGGVSPLATKTVVGLAGLRWKNATGGRFERGRARSDAGGAAHPTVTLAQAGAGCNDDGVERGGCRTSVIVGIGAGVRLRANQAARRGLRGAVSALGTGP